MSYEEKQQLVSENKEMLINILASINCTPYDACTFAMEEYFLGLDNGQYSYHNYHNHFKERYLNKTYGDGSKQPRFGSSLTEVLDQLFYDHISKVYMVIKNAVYERFDFLKDVGDLWEFGLHVADFEEWCGAYCDQFVDDIVDIDWNLIDKDEEEIELVQESIKEFKFLT